MTRDKTDPVDIAFEEIQAIASKYNLIGLITITTEDSSIIRAEVFEHKDGTLAAQEITSKKLSKMFANTVAIVHRTMRSVYKNLLTLDVSLQAASGGDRAEMDRIYTTIEANLDSDINEVASVIQAATFATKEDFDKAASASTLDDIP